MAEENPEQILWREYLRLARPQGAEEFPPAAGLVGAETTDLQQPERVLAAAAESLRSSPINKGYAEPAASAQETGSSGGSVAGEIGKTMLNVFKSGLGLMPLISGLVGLFGGGGDAAPPAPLVRYAMPRAIHIEAANAAAGSGCQPVDYGQSGELRVAREDAAAGAAWPISGAAAPQVVVQVQAMDSRSFLDHSQEIAQAVREAMLQMHPLNDVVNEL